MANSAANTSRLHPQVDFLEALADLGGHKLFFRRGGTGGPAILFETGCGTSADDWKEVQTALSLSSTTLAYDRAGCGRSDRGAGPRTPGTIVAELRLLLRALQMAPPYILVGHSLGGLSMRLFAHLYGPEVAGMILVDSAHEEMRSRLPADYWSHEQSSVARMSGIGREEALSLERGFDELRNAGSSLGELPLTVITAGRKFFDAPRGIRRTPIRAAWSELQRDLVARSSAGRQVLVRDSGHSVHRERPDLVIEELQRMLELVRR